MGEITNELELIAPKSKRPQGRLRDKIKPVLMRQIKTLIGDNCTMDVIEKDREIEQLNYKVGWQSAALAASVEALKDERIEREKLQKRLDENANLLRVTRACVDTKTELLDAAENTMIVANRRIVDARVELAGEKIEREKLQKRLDDCANEALRKISALEEQLSATRDALHKSRSTVTQLEATVGVLDEEFRTELSKNS